MRLSLTVDAAGALRLMDGQISAVSKPFGGKSGSRVLSAIRAAIAEEFARGAERTDSGFRPWPKSHDFGTRKAASPPLGGSSGRYAQAWAGGAGGFSSVRPTEIRLGARLPGAALHRGDLGPSVTIRPKRGPASNPPMRYALGLGFGVWISPERLQQGLVVPARPHARANMALGRIIREAFLGGA